jgi:hypothetical protein
MSLGCGRSKFLYELWVFQPRSGKRSARLTYSVTGLTAANGSPRDLLQVIRSHWTVESGLH